MMRRRGTRRTAAQLQELVERSERAGQTRGTEYRRKAGQSQLQPISTQAKQSLHSDRGGSDADCRNIMPVGELRNSPIQPVGPVRGIRNRRRRTLPWILQRREAREPMATSGPSRRRGAVSGLKALGLKPERRQA